MTEKAIDIILEKILGKSKNKFGINKISELEAKIITSFNGFIYDALKPKMNVPDPTQLKRTNFDMVNLTFILKDIEPEAKNAGKIIVTLPLALLNPERIESSGNTFNNTDFPNSEIFVKVIMGNMRFPLYDIKTLEQGDVVVFENSDIHKMTLSVQDELLEINLNPNMDLMIPQDDDTEGDNMAARNIWDSIEVEMNAEFDAVKISLAELKSIEDGLVVDLTSLYDNNVTLKVEGKPIASGSLVIVNDRYGVKINNIIAKGQSASPDAETDTSDSEEEDYEEEESYEDNENYDEESSQEQDSEEDDEEDFDYSDFELEDDNL
ncbi:FliM/FliN family flagellar motor switch protein [bacterium]|nr:FliM/FliN family flagellar motor switch protein [bacterium]